MRKSILFVLLAVVTTLSSCYKDDIDDIKSRLDNLEAWQESVNSNISALQSAVKALENNDYVKSVTALSDGSGYVLNFVKSGAVTIKNGEKGADGKDGATPIISVKQDADGKYYWTVNGEWLLNSDGSKVATAGKDGEDGKDGVDGEDGKDGATGATGANGITPKLRISNGIWEYSLDNGASYISTGVKAQGDAIFAENGIDNDKANYVTLTLADGGTITLQRYLTFKIGMEANNDAAMVGEPLTLYLRLPEGFKQSDYTAIMAQVTSNQGTNTDIKTRTATTSWTVEVTKPTFAANGTYNNDATVTITKPADATEGELAIVEVTLVGSDGSKHTATRAVKAGQYSAFQDAKFRREVIQNIPGLKDAVGNLLDAEAASIPLTLENVTILASFAGTLNVNNKGIYSLSGIEYLTGLTELKCSTNPLGTLDVSKNTSLTQLSCSKNQLGTLDVSKNTSLTYLNCSNNTYLSELDVTKNTSLTALNCYSNQLSTLDVSKNTSLTQLSCSKNQLGTLDVSKNTALTYLSCSSNKLSSLDVSKNTSLTALNCYSNPLSTLDVSTNTSLTQLYCYSNKLSTLDVSKNTALTELNCSSNNLSTLDVSKNTALTELNCSSNNLSTLDVSTNTSLTQLLCYSNQLSTLDVSKNTALTYLSCSSNKLSILDVSKNTSLTYLSCSSNKLSILDVSKNTSLTYLSCYSNHLSTLDISKITATMSYWAVGDQKDATTGNYQQLTLSLKHSQESAMGTDNNYKIVLNYID